MNGKWKTEIVRDANIINAYVRKRQIIEEKSMAADAVAPTGDADKDRRAAKLCVQLHFHSDLFDDRTRTDTIVLTTLLPVCERNLRSSRRTRLEG